MIQLYTDKTATNFKANDSVVYPVQITLLNVAKNFRRFNINHGQTIFSLLPVSVFHSAEKIRDDNTAENCYGKYGKNIIQLLGNLHQTAKTHCSIHFPLFFWHSGITVASRQGLHQKGWNNANGLPLGPTIRTHSVCVASLMPWIPT